MISCTDHQYKEVGIRSYQAWQRVSREVLALASVNFSGLETWSPEDMAKARNCLVCQKLVEGLQRHDAKSKLSYITLLRVFPGEQFLRDLERRQGPWTDKFLVIFCIAYPKGEHGHSTTLEPGVLEIELSYSDRLRGFEDIKLWDRRLVNIEKVKNWMTDCEDHHGEMCNKTLFCRTLPRGFLVVDVLIECIVEPHHDIGDYVALSYQWATATAYEDRDIMLTRKSKEELQTPRSLSACCLPEVIQDSMQFCRDIGQRYLWVDRLCIYQDEIDVDGLRQVQIDGMGAIYWLATVTLVASVDGVGAGLLGASSRPRLNLKNHGWRLINSGMDDNFRKYFAEPSRSDLIESSSWNTRGWTFQERWISRRLIFFCRSHCILNCFYCYHCEETFKDNGTLTQNRDRDMTHGASFGTDVRITKSQLNDSAYTVFALYKEAVSSYGARSLGLVSDILNAFSGVNEFLVENLQTTSLFGLPEKYLFQSLLWFRIDRPSSNPKGNIPKGIPSWSWASGYGPIEYRRFNHHEYGNIVRFWFSENGTVREVIEATCWFDQSDTAVQVGRSVDSELNRYDEDTRQRIDENNLPGQGIHETCPHNPQQAIKHRRITDESRALAAKTPGCLAFNTTVVSIRVRVNEAETATSRRYETAQLTVLDINDDEGARIGYTFSEAFPTGHKLPPIIGEDFRCRAVVIGAYNLARFEKETRVIYGGKELDNEGKWSLVVMIVDRKEHLSSRLAIGVVHPFLWQKVNPIWETIFLV